MVVGNPTAWGHTVAEIEQAITACLGILDRYESAFASLLDQERESDPKPDPGQGLTGEAGSRAWDEKLAAAQASAAGVEHLLAEQEQVWGNWLAALADWRRQAESDRT